MKKVVLGLILLNLATNANVKCKESLLDHSKQMKEYSKIITQQVEKSTNNLNTSELKILFENIKKIVIHIRNNHGTDMGINEIKLLNKIEPILERNDAYTLDQINILEKNLEFFENISIPKEYRSTNENEWNSFKLSIAEDRIKDKLKDPDSYKRLNYKVNYNGDKISSIIIEYTAKNGFGGTNREIQTINF